MERRNLIAFRARRGLSQEAMAERIGIARGTYGEIERGNRDCKVSAFEAIQRAFGIPDSEMWELTKKVGEGGRDDG